MKKSIIALGILFTGITYAQTGVVGINTDAPKTTLDVSAKRDASGTLTDTGAVGLIAPRLTREEVTAKEAIYTEAQIGTIIYVKDTSAGDANGSRKYMITPGYFVLTKNVTDGSLLWEKIFTASGYQNVYKNDNEIADTRTVTQADKSLTFRSSGDGKVIMENTTATATSQVTPLRIVDGGQAEGKALFSDADGVATWKTFAPKSVVGKVAAAARSYDAADKVWLVGSGATITSITLPPGKWLVIAGTTFNIRFGDTKANVGSATFANSYDSGYIAEFFLSDDQSEGATSIQANITQDAETLASGDKKSLFSVPVPIWSSTNYGFGQQVIHNTTTADKTYYMKMFIDSTSKYQSNPATVVPIIGSEARPTGDTSTPGQVYVFQPFGSTVGEKVLYAIKMADVK
ncbi:hypothetical protein BPO_0700 [Bergeyella porcorum]|uniref:Uncharacterized protein n=1 Tax=Bergeyella porcorum TaxID=1735111 RepID=A0AAU0F3K7_9FLAO